MNLTKNEVTALEAIVGSEYQCGNEEEDVVGHRVWTSYCNPFKTRKTFSGVISSLVKKGYVKASGSWYDANYAAKCDGTTLEITKAGWDALQSAKS